MGNWRRKRILIASGAIILLCMVIIVGMTSALFTDSKRVTNHLQAGNLEVGLKRTYLEYKVLDDDGKLALTTDDSVEDFTDSNGENIFGVDAENIRIVPGSYFKAEMEITNEGNVAFTYNLSIKLLEKPNALTEQLNVIITDSKGVTTTAKLSAMANGLTINAGEMLVNDTAQRFTVTIGFIDDIDYNKTLEEGEARMNNNSAQSQSAVFDLVVTAVQATTTATTAPATEPATP